uniref:Uncharacterized protein n=1 Tax=Clytia hemisphaerica TaxID=252671 RepID=A0A7M5WRB4_9CNID|eukprot:TCONS_00061498-protein
MNHSETDRNQNMLEKLKEEHRKEIKILGLEKNMEVLELRNENEILKHKLEILELKTRKDESEKVTLNEKSNVADNVYCTRFITVKERLAWGFKQYFHNGDNQSNLYESYAVWYESLACKMKNKEVYSSKNHFHFVKKHYGEYEKFLSLISKRVGCNYTESSNELIVKGLDKELWQTATIIILHPKDIAQCMEMEKYDQTDQYEEWYQGDVPEEMFNDNDNSVIFLILVNS